MRRQSPLKVIEIKSRINNTKEVMYEAKFDREKCISCNGTGMIGVTHGIGCHGCDTCGGTGKCPFRELESQILYFTPDTEVIKGINRVRPDIDYLQCFLLSLDLT
jgi:RecJ-like exonuclease